MKHYMHGASDRRRIDYNLLHVALGDTRHISVAYPILARYGLMERTKNSFKSIDREVIIRRCHELIDRLGQEAVDA